MTSDEFLSAFGRFVDAPRGFQKLRELVLQLAVQGKLVAQNPSDQPASLLLENIFTEKLRLIEEGEIRGPNKLGSIDEDSLPFATPPGWQWERLGNITTRIGSGSTPRGGKSAYVDTGVLFLRSQNVWNDGLKIDEAVFIKAETHEKMSNTSVFGGDILLNITGASLGRCTIVPDDLGAANVSQHVTIIRPVHGEITRFLHLTVLSPMIQAFIWGRQVGMAREGLSKKVLELFEFPIPPLAEQHRIVAKVDELMSLCDKLEAERSARNETHTGLIRAVHHPLTGASDATSTATAWRRIRNNFADLYTTRESVQALRQTILQLAVQGKLVGRDDTADDASRLVKEIAATKGANDLQRRTKKKTAAVGPDRQSLGFALPTHWEAIYLGSTIDLVSGQHLKPDEYSDSPEGIPYLTGPADFGPIHPIPNRFTEKRRAVAILGDILITVKGSGVGKLNIVDVKEAAISRQLMAVRPLVVLPEFIFLILSEAASHFQTQKVGIAIPGIGRDDVLMYPIGLPPLPEQHRIVAKVDELMALCDQLDAAITARDATASQYAEAVVRQLSAA